MLIIPTKDLEIIKSIFPGEPNMTHDWFLVFQEKALVGLFELQPISKITGILHLHIKEEFQKKGLGILAFNTLVQYLRRTEYRTLLATIPASNNRILSIVKKTQAKCCGILANSIIYKNQLQDQILFSLDIKR